MLNEVEMGTNADASVAMSANLENLSKEDLIVKCKDLMASNDELEKRLEASQLNNEKNEKIKPQKKEHKQRAFDFSKYGKRHVAFRFLYLGMDYQGFAAQENTSNTIEDKLFSALLRSKLIEDRSSANYSRCGRTDKGVSAFGQVIALDVRSKLPSRDDVVISDVGNSESGSDVELPFVQILNRLLPPDIRVLAYASVDKSFDARFSCKTRTYKYFFPAGNLDVELMHEAAQKLVGENDFRNFCKVDIGNNVNHFIRNVVSFKVRRLPENTSPHNICEMEITGLAFLWHQVRCMAAVLLLVGLHLEPPTVIDFLLDIDKCPKRPQYNMASEFPLVLYDCAYEGINWIYERSSNEPNINRIQQFWSKKAIHSAMLRSMLDDLIPRTLLNTSPSLSILSVVLHRYREDNYKPLNERAVCEGLDRHLEKLAAKRIKLEEKYILSKNVPT